MCQFILSPSCAWEGKLLWTIEAWKVRYRWQSQRWTQREGPLSPGRGHVGGADLTKERMGGGKEGQHLWTRSWRSFSEKKGSTRVEGREDQGREAYGKEWELGSRCRGLHFSSSSYKPQVLTGRWGRDWAASEECSTVPPSLWIGYLPNLVRKLSSGMRRSRCTRNRAWMSSQDCLTLDNVVVFTWKL